ncbi:hypothetical protein GFC01_03095 [Desulfofundulus thermobenzoicus]|uniref:Uncharacterized protein n=1 Tax=Desulfofundulus thermobenzoicus TaxID=29376 RepID=A0A6N7INR6_9FIRM|nr:hypothetical protein [Desulfofundulus thermobenzoicus]MQL51263.1 hypothetical protein [Desulfofundulus thermobenzoicus]
MKTVRPLNVGQDFWAGWNSTAKRNEGTGSSYGEGTMFSGAANYVDDEILWTSLLLKTHPFPGEIIFCFRRPGASFLQSAPGRTAIARQQKPSTGRLFYLVKNGEYPENFRHAVTPFQAFSYIIGRISKGGKAMRTQQWFDGPFIIFLILILLVFGTGWWGWNAAGATNQ